MVRSQEDSLSSDLYIANGKRIYVFIPVDPEDKAIVDKALISNPREIVSSVFPDNFMHMDKDLKDIPASSSEEDVRRVLNSDYPKSEKKAASAYLEKKISLKELQDFVFASWQTGSIRFKVASKFIKTKGISYQTLATMDYL